MRPRAVLLLAALVLVSCGGDDRSTLPHVNVVFGPSTQPVLTIEARVASTPEQRNTGLMGVKGLPENRGMLFLFREPVRVGFYMKDTLIPLDIAFIGRGIVLEIRSMEPCKMTKGCPVTYPNATYEMALEVDAGTFSKAGIGPGTVVKIDGTLPTAE